MSLEVNYFFPSAEAKWRLAAETAEYTHREGRAASGNSEYTSGDSLSQIKNDKCSSAAL